MSFLLYISKVYKSWHAPLFLPPRHRTLMFHHDSPHNGLTGLVLAKAIGLDRAVSRKANESIPSRLRRRQTDAGHGPEQSAQRAPVHRRRSSGYQPPPPCLHLPPRTHCLTPLPFDNEVHNSPILHEQTQSLLLKLPQEVRLLIYEEVLGNRLIHIVRRNHKLGHVSVFFEFLVSLLHCIPTRKSYFSSRKGRNGL